MKIIDALNAYRGKTGDEKWIYGYKCGNCILIPTDSTANSYTSVTVDPKTICRCSGINAYDTNGQRGYLFEKDIVVFKNGTKHVVKYDIQCGYWYIESILNKGRLPLFDINTMEDIVIIGNSIDCTCEYLAVFSCMIPIKHGSRICTFIPDKIEIRVRANSRDEALEFAYRSAEDRFKEGMIVLNKIEIVPSAQCYN